MRRILYLIYGTASYVLFLGVFLYLIAFTGDVAVPRSVNAGPQSPVALALVVNLALMTLFGVQHSVMAREGFKRWMRGGVPKPLVRSTYVLASSVALAVVLWGWQPIPIEIWSVSWQPGQWALWAVFGLGWTILLISTFLIDHFELFGLKQVWLYVRGREPEPPEFKTPGFYKVVRHPLMVGFLLAFWATPEMTVGHMLFAGGMSAYILVGTHFEERDLVRVFGERYRAYRAQVPRFVPWKSRPREAKRDFTIS